jgi:hypothetical protein
MDRGSAEAGTKRTWHTVEVQAKTDLPLIVPELVKQVCDFITRHHFDFPYKVECEVRVSSQGCVNRAERTDLLNAVSTDLHGACISIHERDETQGDEKAARQEGA